MSFVKSSDSIPFYVRIWCVMKMPLHFSYRKYNAQLQSFVAIKIIRICRMSLLRRRRRRRRQPAKKEKLRIFYDLSSSSSSLFYCNGCAEPTDDRCEFIHHYFNWEKCSVRRSYIKITCFRWKAYNFHGENAGWLSLIDWHFGIGTYTSFDIRNSNNNM